MNIGTVIHGFKLESITPIEELEAQLYFFRHEKTGAELIWSKRNDTNKTFSVAFETLPENDTGVFHILEHSVLCGSDKYTVKEPFVELLKSSMNTFLNAMTFSDKTMYPVSSRNDADFRNLMSVYLDAVFKPAIYQKESIFLQEGWRNEIDPETGKPHYIGVVFNEMKGAMSSVDSVLHMEMGRMLFPDNCYRYVSGGNPKSIPDLTYEEFLNNHRRFYHPSNARFFLDGNVDLDTCLADINDGYLCHYDRRERDFELKLQAPVASQCKTASYEIGADEKAEGKAHFALGKVVASWKEYAYQTAAMVLCDYLAGSNDAPLKRELLRQGLAQDVRLGIINGTAQASMLLHLRNVNEEALPTLRSKITEILQSILEKGLDHDELTACLNRHEFNEREHNEPYGLILNITMLSSWLYGGDPALYLKNNELFATVRAMLENGDFERIMQEIFLDETGMCELHLLPSTTLGAEKLSAELERAAKEYDALTEEEKAAHEKKLDTLHRWQQTPDSPEQLAALPHLELSDVSKEPQWTELSKETIRGARVLRSPVNASGMVYLKLYFPMGNVTLEDISLVKILSLVLSKLPTKAHTVQELQREIKANIGALDYSVETYADQGDAHNCVPCFVINCSVLESKVDEAIRLIHEVQLDTLLDQKSQIREILQQAEIRMQQRIIMQGHSVGLTRVLSAYNAEMMVDEHTNGYTAYTFVKELNRDFDQRIDGVVEKLEQLRQQISRSAGLTVGVTGHVSKEQLEALIGGFPVGENAESKLYCKPIGQRAEGIVIPAGISFAESGVLLSDLGYQVNGKTRVLANLVSLAYLWNEVRVQGGAYGCGMSARRMQLASFHSFRDPNAARSLDVYRNTSKFIRDFCQRKDDSLSNIIIGTISKTEPLASPRDQGNQAFDLYLHGFTLEQMRQERLEMLQTTHDDLLALCPMLDAMAEKSSVCVVGNNAILEQCKGLTVLA